MKGASAARMKGVTLLLLSIVCYAPTLFLRGPVELLRVPGIIFVLIGLIRLAREARERKAAKR